MMHPRPARFLAFTFLSLVVVSGCIPGDPTARTVDPSTIPDAPPDGRLTDASSPDATDASVDVPRAPAAPLLLGLTLHLENHAPYDSAYATALQSFATTVSGAGGVLTLEPRQEVLMGGSAVTSALAALETAGHTVGSHAATGDESGLTQTQFQTNLLNRRGALLGVVSSVNDVSGICSSLDFVTAAANVGFTFTTSATAQCLLALSTRPAGYEDLSCASATDARCHAPYPTELTARIHPWRALDGAHWLTDDAAGRLVILPSSGSVPCLAEEATSDGGLTTCRLDDTDVTMALADLDAAIAAVDASRVNTYYWVWGSWDWSSTAVDPRALNRLLSEVGRRVTAGAVRWATAQQMYDAYVAWESTHR